MSDAAEPDAAVTSDTVLRLGRGFRLQWEPAQEAHVLLYPEGMVNLNLSAAEILKRCDGQRSIAHITAELEQVFDEPDLSQEVLSFAAIAVEQRWLQEVS